MLWTYELNKSYENKKIIPENLFRSKKMNVHTNKIKKDISEPCVESAVDIFGLKIYVVLDYENAIKELTKNVNGKCDYNSVWIMCGPQKAILPNPKADPNLIGEFMKVINIFWKNGGSLVFFADGDPLFYQVNLFLQEAEFPLDDDEDSDEQTNDFRNNINNYEYEKDSFRDNLTKFNTEENEKEDNFEEQEVENNYINNEEQEEENNYINNEEQEVENNFTNNEEQEEEEEMNLNNRIMEENEEKGKIFEKMEDKKLKANFRIVGSHEGTNTLFRDKTGLLKENMRFNGSNKVAANLKRPNIGENLLKIYEGVTISYAMEQNNEILSIFERLGLSRMSAQFLRKKNDNPIYPFIPFARDSEGGISIMIYYGIGCGDVVIDCGFTKCFIEMKEEGTFRYIRNLSAVTSRCDVLMKNGEDPQTWKPDFINYKLDLSKKYFWEDFKRKIYIIDIDKPLKEETKKFIYDQIINGIYSEYNNIIYFYSNGIRRIKLEDIIKENSLIPEINKQNNMDQIAENILHEVSEKFGNNYNLEIFSDGYCQERDNKFIDFILTSNNIDMNRCLYQLLPGLDIDISPEFTLLTLRKLEAIKTLEEFNENYKNIRNCLIFLPYQYSIKNNINIFGIKSSLERISNEIIDSLQDEMIRGESMKKMKALLFYVSTEIEDVGTNAAAGSEY